MRKYCYLLGAIMTVSLAGCSVDERLEKEMLKQSGIIQESSYIDYQDKVLAGNIDEEGYFQEADAQEEIGKVHVTFAMNNNLNIQYFRDQEHTVPVDTAFCYLKEGDAIYAEAAVSRNVSSAMYGFSGFHIYEYEDGERRLCDTLQSSYPEEGIVLRIPEGYTGTELSVEPFGKYRQVTLSLKDHYTDAEGAEHSLDGRWFLDDAEYTDDTVEISPVGSYIISYEYDSGEFFYVSSEPECYYHNPEDGTVIFAQRNAGDETTAYSVMLHQYMTAALASGEKRTVKVNGEARPDVEENQKLEITRLKYGDKVLIETNRIWPELETSRELILTDTERYSGGYKYTLVVPEKDGQFVFDPSEYTYEHGTITFRCFGSVVSGVQYLAKGTPIYYEQDTAEEGYWLSGRDHCIRVGEEEETKRQLESIHFTQIEQVTVHLGQPAYGGKITYYADDKRIAGDEFKTYSGTVIRMDFDPWEGWICSATDGAKYTVDERSKQAVNVNGADISEIFTEDEEHKPELTVVLEKSVGEDIQFDFAASGLMPDSYTYESGWFRTDYTIINKRKIGTESPIVVSMKNKAIRTGKAVKIAIQKQPENAGGQHAKEIRYVDDLTELQDPIYVYQDTEIADSEVWYESILVRIGMADVSSFAMPDAGSDRVLTVRREEDGKVLEEGDFVEGNQKVTVTISPKDGYYIVDGNIADETAYQETIKYEKYLSKIEKLLQKHAPEKFYQVILDRSDAFAEYTYSCDGEEITESRVLLREGQKLTLKYEITDAEYRLREAAGGFLWFGKSDKKAEESITVSQDMDGRTVTKSDFGIEAGKGEEGDE